MFKNKSRDMMYIVVFLTLVPLLWLGLSLLPEPARMQLPGDVQGGYDLTHNDFNDAIYTIARVWDSWPEKLYTPEELAGAQAPVPHESLDYTQTRYATHRLRINLVPGASYGLSYFTSDYSMRLYIDGVEMASAGSPGTTREETEPRVHKLTTYFTPQNKTTEIVVQTANFVHHEGGRAPILTIGSTANIARYERSTDLKAGIVVGCLMTAFLYFLVIFLMNRAQISSLLFSILCLLLALASGEFLVRLFPVYSWQFSIRAEYIIYVLVAVVLILLVESIFPHLLHKWCRRIYLSLCGGDICLALFTDTTFFTGFRNLFLALSITMIVYGLVCLLLTFKERTMRIKNIFASLGIVLFASSVIVEILMRYRLQTSNNVLAEINYNAGYGMMLFVFCYAFVVSFEQAEINARLESSRATLAEAEERYHNLEKERKDERQPLTKLSDIGLTKRESEVALLLLDGKSREEISGLLFISIGTVNFHCNNVYRKAGVRGVVELTSLILQNKPI